MAVTYTSTLSARNVGFYTVTTVTFDNSYEEGGETLTAAQLGLASVDHAICNVNAGSAAEANPVSTAFYTPSTSKIHLIDGKTSKEMAAEKDMSKVVVRVTAFGKARSQ